MNVADLINQLTQSGVSLGVDGDELRVNVPTGAIAPGLAAQIRDNEPDILKFLRDVSIAKSDNAMPPLVRRTADGYAPVSFAQQRLWYVDQLKHDNAIYNLPAAFTLTGSPDVALLEQAINDIVSRHDCLRITLAMKDDNLVQIVSPEVHIELHMCDYRDKSEADFTQFYRQQTAQPFDLATGPMLRAWLIQVDDTTHVLFFVVEHAAFDRDSFDIFLREMVHCYEARLAGQAPGLPPLAMQYGDYAAWQRQCLQGDVQSDSLTFWREQLSGELPVLALPTDHPRPPEQCYDSASESFFLSKTELQGVMRFAHENDTTVFSIMLAAFKVLLYRYTGQRDVIIGSPVPGRVHPGLEGMMGLFVNALVLRTELDPQMRFQDLVAQVKKVCCDAFAHQNTPFELLVEDLKPTRDLSRSPLVQVTFMYKDVAWRDTTMADVDIGQIIIDSPAVLTDINFRVRETSAGMEGGLEYATALFDASTIVSFVEHYKTLLLAAVANPAQTLSQLPMLSDSERKRMLTTWNDTRVDYPADVSLHRLIEVQAKKTPQRTALVFNDEMLGYQVLNKQANQLAHYLRSQGVKRGDLTGIFIERSLDMVIALLGILKAGATYLPLDPGCPHDRLALMLKDSQVSLILTQKIMVERLPESNARLVCLDNERALIDAQIPDDPVAEVSADDLAYIIYTSGSTGKPKGVEITHRNVVNFLFAMQKEPGITAADTLLSVTTVSFDISVLEIFLPLINGAKVVIADNESTIDGHRLSALIEAHDATMMQATPSTWRLLIGAGWQGTPRFKVLCGGEALQADLAAHLYERSGSVWNMYGPTETTVWSTCYLLTGADAPVFIGRAIANTRVYILDENRNLVPPGVSGELCIGGDGVARGYHKRPELTAERFIVDPFSSNTGARLYRTGDLVRCRADGIIEYQGRADNQVKVRGHRIELGDIETALIKHESVKESVVTVLEERPGDKRIIAYVVFQENLHANVIEFRKFLHTQLPNYMVPNLFIDLDELPQTPNGKVDRKALPNPFTYAGQSANHEEPETEIAQTLARLWKEALGIERIGLYDNFFDLGGHSLLSMQIISQFEKSTGLKIGPREMVQGTLAQVADMCEKQVSEKKNSSGDSILGKLRHFIAK